MAKIAINGFGRIGRLFFRQAFGQPGLDIVAINDPGDIENLAYLLRHDSVYRGFDGHEVSTKDGHLVVDGKTITVMGERDATKLNWGSMGIDLVVECTGLFEGFEKASVHTAAGAKHVVISAPAKDAEGTLGGRTILMGINEDQLKGCTISSNGSCTTNATAPVVQILHDEIGIVKAALSTVHAYTGTQLLVDSSAKGKDFRRGRAAAQNIVPSSTGAAVSVTRVVGDLKGKFDGIALRVPVITGSLTDLTFVAKRKTTVEEVNEIFKKAAASPRWKGIVGVSEDQPVSSDIIGMSYATLVDLEYTKVIDGDLVKVLSWYDNEWSYVCTLIAHVNKICQAL